MTKNKHKRHVSIVNICLSIVHFFRINQNESIYFNINSFSKKKLIIAMKERVPAITS